MASSLLGRFFCSSVEIFFIPRKLTSAICINSYSWKLGGDRMISSLGLSPCLMLPPAAGSSSNSMVYKYFSLAEKTVSSIQLKSECEWAGGYDFVGSSHGWLGLFNKQSNDLFLSSPVSRRRIKLELPEASVSVSKVILDGDEKCRRAVMIFGPGNRLAFCRLPRARARAGCCGIWYPFGELTFAKELYAHRGRYLRLKVYEDLLYCHTRKVLICITPIEFDLVSFQYRGNFFCEMEIWDIGDPLLSNWEFDATPSPNTRRLWVKRGVGVGAGGKITRSWVVENMFLLKRQCIQMPHLVYAEQSNQLFLVMRFVVLMGPNGSRLHRVPHCPIKGLSGHHRCQTVGFVVVKVNDNASYEVVDSLNGLAMFVGANHSFAISASDFPELKPNSIYFTDAKRLLMLDGVIDTGVFDYENKTLSPIITGDDPLESSPIWFYPPQR